MWKLTTYDGETTTDAKWWQKLACQLARWPKKSIQMLKQIGLYVNIITSKYMLHVSLILLVPCLNIYLHPLYKIIMGLTSRQPHPLYVPTIGLTMILSHPLYVMTIGSTSRQHPLYVKTIGLTMRLSHPLYVMTIGLTTTTPHPLYVLIIYLTTNHNNNFT